MSNTLNNLTAIDQTSTCFHCGETLRGNVYFARIQQQDQAMCCIGCQAAAEMIDQAGMSDFYQQRDRAQTTRPAQRIDQNYWQNFDQAAIAEQYLRESDNSSIVNVSLHVEDIYCSACSWLIECSYQVLAGIQDLRISLSQKRIRIGWDSDQHSFSDILLVLAQLGYQPQPLSSFAQSDSLNQEHHKAMKRIAVAGLGMMQVMGFAFALYADEVSHSMDSATEHFLNLVSLIVTTAVVFYSGAPFFQHALRDLRSRHLGMDVPVAIAIGCAYSSSVWNTFAQNGATIYFDSAVMFIFFLSLGRFLELRIHHQALNSQEALSQLLPPLVTVQRQGQTLTLPPVQLQRGDIIQRQTGDVIPCDAVITEGEGRFDESLLTGEAYSLQRSAGDEVLSGSTLCSGKVTIEVKRSGQDSTLAQIGELLDQAQCQRPQQSQLADRIARHFVLIVLSIASVVGLIWWQIDSSQSLAIVLAVLVVTCPCALSLATPAALTAAAHSLRRQGIVVSNSNALETLSHVDHWCFDKTGTLTTGKMTLQDTAILGSLDKKQCLQIAHLLEKDSSHPLAQAFYQSFEQAEQAEPAINDWQEVSGNGVSARIGEARYFLGRRHWALASVQLPEDSSISNSHHGSEAVLCRIKDQQKGELLAVFTANDSLREQAKASLAQLHSPCSLLSGDNLDNVQYIAQQLDISDYAAALQPEDKLQRLKQLQQQHSVAMVGDGINDAPVLAQADVSISLASASQLAQSHADILILNNRMSSLVHIKSKAQQCTRIIKQNLGWAALYNLSALPLAATGVLSPWMAAIGMSASSLLVVLNASRLNREP